MSKYIIIGLIYLFPAEIMAAVQPSVPELIHKYAQTQNNIQPSFISKKETKAICTYNFPDRKVQANNVERYSIEECRWDGSRAKIIKNSWGWMHSRRTRDENNKAYNSWLFDGNKYYAYGNGTVDDQFVEGYPGKGSLRGEHEKKHSAQMARRMVHTDPFLGYFWAGKRVDECILHDKDAYVHNEMQKVGEFQCYVVTAKPAKGIQLKVWIAPEHGYNLAKFECRFGEGYDPIGPGRPYGKGSYIYLAGTIRSFKKIDGTWVPMEMDYRENSKYPGGHIQKRRVNYKQTEFLINPDHDALGSFLPDDIPNGALIFAHGTRYTWQDGKLIPKIDKVVMAQIDEEVEKLLKEKVNPKYKPYAINKEPNEVAQKRKPESLTPPTDLTVSELLAKYQANQNRLQSFITKGKSTFEIAGKSSEISRMEKTASEFRYDGSRVNHRVRSWNDEIPPCKARYESFLWDGESFIKYQQESDSDKSRVFVSRHNSDKNKMIAKEYKGAALMGICGGDYERIDLILGKARSISLHDKTDTIGGSECYLIEANTKRGRYKVWIDPAHGYNIASVEVQKNKRDLIHYMEPLKTKMSFSLKNVRFEKIDDVWVPMEADIQQTEDNGNKIIRWHHKRIEFALNPDHGALKSFVPDDIPDGTKVKLTGDSKKYEWRKGKPVAVVD